MKDRREGKHRDNRRSTEMKEKRQSREKQRKRQWGAGEEWHWGWTRRNGHHRTTAERADRWRHADKKQRLLAGRVKRKKKSERPLERRLGERGRRVSGEKKARRGGARLKCIDVREWDNTHTHTHQRQCAGNMLAGRQSIQRTGETRLRAKQRREFSERAGKAQRTRRRTDKDTSWMVQEGGQVPSGYRFNIFCRHLLLVFVLHSRTSAFSPLFTASHKKMTFVKTLLYLPGWGCHLSLTWERHQRL